MKRKQSTAPSYMRDSKRRKLASSTPVIRAEVSRQIRAKGDIKYTDVSTSFTDISSAGIIISATSNLVRGTAGIDNFLGNNLTPTGFSGKFIFTSAQQTFAVCRVLVFQWFDASVPTLSGILQNSISSPQVVLSPVLVTNKSQMKILWDQNYYISPPSADAGVVFGQGGLAGKFYIPGSRLRKLKANSSTNAIQDGGIYVLYLSQDSTAAFPSFAMYNRLSFMD